MSPIPQDSLSSPNHLPPTQEERARFSTPLPAGSGMGGYPYSFHPHTVGGHGPPAAGYATPTMALSTLHKARLVRRSGVWTIP